MSAAAARNVNDNENTTFIPGLPGKNIKIGTAAPISASRPKPAVALGISLLDTDVARPNAAKPEQIFPLSLPSRQNLAPDAQPKQRKVPAPLNLDDELSPFDRYVPIALSVPANTTSFAEASSSRQQQLTPATGSTPAIVITPTDCDRPTLDVRRTVYPSGRPPSSVYMPQVPSFERRSWAKRAQALAAARASGTALRSRPRADSELTHIEDDSPSLVPYQKTPAAQSRPKYRSSFDALIPTPRRSKGWWNMFVSPLIRSNSLHSTRFSPLSAGDAPELAVLDRAASIDGAETSSPTSEQSTTRDVTSDNSRAGTTTRDVSSQDAADTTTTGRPKSAAAFSTFYMIPTTGEAAPYYDPTLEFCTPKIPDTNNLSVTDLSRGGSNRTQNTIGSDSSQQEVGNSPEPETIHEPKPAPLFLDTRHARKESAPDAALPLSARAEICDGNDKHITSPLSASPVVGIASAARFESARQIQHRSPQPPAVATPMPEPQVESSREAAFQHQPPAPVVAMPEAQPEVTMSRAQPEVAMPEAQPAVAMPSPKHEVDVPRAQPVVAMPEAHTVVAMPEAQVEHSQRPALVHQSTLDKLTAPQSYYGPAPRLPPPPTDLPSRDPTPSSSRPLSVASDRSTDRLAPLPPAKDAEKTSRSVTPAGQDESKDGHSKPGFWDKLLNGSSYKSPARSANAPYEKVESGPGLMSKAMNSDFMQTHYTSPPRAPVKNPQQARWRRNICILGLAGLLFAVVLIIVLVALLVPRSHDDMDIKPQWVNTTGFPPLPTGIVTVAQPSLSWSKTSCVQPAGLWSCSVPQGSGAIGGLPDFRLEIRFRNGTLPSNLTQVFSPNTTHAYSGAAMAAATLKAKRDIFSSLLFAADPSVPPASERAFLGLTTDNVTAPGWGGVETPFYVSFLPPDLLQSNGSKTAAPSSTVGKSSLMARRGLTSNDTSNIPLAPLSANGSASLGELYPLPTAQPLRLFDRGLATEHYGFYSYFDRTVMVKLPSAIPDASSVSVTDVGSGNSTGPELTASVGSANAVCVFSQTRFLVRVWTRSNHALLGGGQKNSSSNLEDGKASNNSSAFDWTRPGSFPYPITISLDRHGGDAERKGVYCYGVDAAGNVETEAKAWIDEDRAAGGKLVNAAGGNFEKATDKDAAGVDGGTGGCSCGWRNWS